MPERVIVDRVVKALKEVMPELTDEQAERLGAEQAALLIDQVIRLDSGTEAQEIEVPASFVDSFLAENIFGRLISKLTGVEPKYKTIKVTVDWSRFVTPGGVLEPRDVSIEESTSPPC